MSTAAARCGICGSADIHAMPFGYQFSGRWLGALRCRACGIIFLHPQPTADELRGLYQKEYFESDFRCGHAGSYFDEAALSRLGDEELLGKIKRFRSSGTLLEIGCAGGAFLNAARSAGFDVRGIEYSEEAAQFARTKFSLSVDTGDAMSVSLPLDSFDVVFMGDVLEHIPNPLENIRRIHDLMKPGGLLVIRCPMQTNTLFSRTGFFVYTLLGRKATVHLPPYHLYEYRPGSMKRLLTGNGFRVESVIGSVIPPSDISLRGSAVQNLFKKGFQYPNWILTKMSGAFGDRIELYAIKQSKVGE